MRRIYTTFLTLLLTASVALTALLSTGARMRGGDGGAVEIAVSSASFVALAIAALLLVRVMFVLSRRPMISEREEGGSR